MNNTNVVNQNTLAMCKEREQDVFSIIKHYPVFQSQGLHCLISAFIPSQVGTLSSIDLTTFQNNYLDCFEDFDPLMPIVKDGLRILPQQKFYPWLLFSGDLSSYWACDDFSQEQVVNQRILDIVREGVLGLSLFYRINKLTIDKIILFIDIPDVEGYSIPSSIENNKPISISLKRVFCQREIDVNASKEILLKELGNLIKDFYSEIPFPLGCLRETLARLNRTPLLGD